MYIKVMANGHSIIFVLNDSQGAKALYEQLPLDVKVEKFGHNEKIFYPPKKLSIAQTPLADAKAGTLAYYAPWGDVVMFYKAFGTAKGLYGLGAAVSGAEHIETLSGTLRIEKHQP